VPLTPKRHAPRGPMIQKDHIEGADPMKARCTATNRQGKRCGKSPIPGGTVCRMHGGAAPQVKQKAMERLMELQHPAISRLAALIDLVEFPTVAYAASRDVLDRTIGKPKESQTIEHSGGIVVKWQDEDE
jgi:hypothetical protein